MISVYSGRECIGWVFARGRSGFEAYDAAQQSLGIFATQREATVAVMEASP
jgi:hypothetical protein